MTSQNPAKQNWYYLRCGVYHNSLPSGDKVETGGFYVKDDEGGIVTQFYTEQPLVGKVEQDNLIIEPQPGVQAISYAEHSDKEPCSVDFRDPMTVQNWGMIDSFTDAMESPPVATTKPFAVQIGSETWYLYTVSADGEVEALHAPEYPRMLRDPDGKLFVRTGIPFGNAYSGTSIEELEPSIHQFDGLFDFATAKMEFIETTPCPK